MTLSDLKNAQVSALIQYIDIDGRTILHEKKATGPVHHVNDEVAIVIAVNGDKENLFKVPPLIEAFKFQLDGSYAVHWCVFRKQETRQDGEHEWWDWKPQL